MSGFTYKSYSFIDKSPIIDYVRTAVNKSSKTLKWIGDESGVRPSTIAKWLYGETKQPKEASLNAVLRVLGYKLEVVLLRVSPAVRPTSIEKHSNVHRLPVRKRKARQ